MSNDNTIPTCNIWYNPHKNVVLILDSRYKHKPHLEFLEGPFNQKLTKHGKFSPGITVVKRKRQWMEIKGATKHARGVGAPYINTLSQSSDKIMVVVNGTFVEVKKPIVRRVRAIFAKETT